MASYLRWLTLVKRDTSCQFRFWEIVEIEVCGTCWNVKMLKKFNMSNDKFINTPPTPDQPLSKDMCSKISEEKKTNQTNLILKCNQCTK